MGSQFNTRQPDLVPLAHVRLATVHSVVVCNFATHCAERAGARATDLFGRHALAIDRALVAAALLPCKPTKRHAPRAIGTSKYKRLERCARRALWAACAHASYAEKVEAKKATRMVARVGWHRLRARNADEHGRQQQDKQRHCKVHSWRIGPFRRELEKIEINFDQRDDGRLFRLAAPRTSARPINTRNPSSLPHRWALLYHCCFAQLRSLRRLARRRLCPRPHPRPSPLRQAQQQRQQLPQQPQPHLLLMRPTRRLPPPSPARISALRRRCQRLRRARSPRRRRRAAGTTWRSPLCASSPPIRPCTRATSSTRLSRCGRRGASLADRASRSLRLVRRVLALVLPHTPAPLARSLSISVLWFYIGSPEVERTEPVADVPTRLARVDEAAAYAVARLVERRYSHVAGFDEIAMRGARALMAGGYPLSGELGWLSGTIFWTISFFISYFFFVFWSCWLCWASVSFFNIEIFDIICFCFCFWVFKMFYFCFWFLFLKKMNSI